MTTAQEITLSLMKDQGFNQNDFSFVVYMYEGIRSIYDREPVTIKHNFPSVRAAVAFMDHFHPHIYYYDIELTNEKVNCPFPYRQIL